MSVSQTSREGVFISNSNANVAVFCALLQASQSVMADCDMADVVAAGALALASVVGTDVGPTHQPDLKFPLIGKSPCVAIRTWEYVCFLRNGDEVQSVQVGNTHLSDQEARVLPSCKPLESQPDVCTACWKTNSYASFSPTQQAGRQSEEAAAHQVVFIPDVICAVVVPHSFASSRAIAMSAIGLHSPRLLESLDFKNLCSEMADACSHDDELQWDIALHELVSSVKSSLFTLIGSSEHIPPIESEEARVDDASIADVSSRTRSATRDGAQAPVAAVDGRKKKIVPKLRIASFNGNCWTTCKAYLRITPATVVCLQEHKLKGDLLDEALLWAKTNGWASFWAPAASTLKRGLSGGGLSWLGLTFRPGSPQRSQTTCFVPAGVLGS